MFASRCFDIMITMSHSGLAARAAKMKPDNEFGVRMKQMMMSFSGDRFKKMAQSEIKMYKNNPDTKIIYVSFDPGMADEIYDENEVLVVSGNPEVATIVLEKLHEYQKFVNATTSR